MYKNVLHATHPDMIRSTDNATLAGRHVITDLFVPDQLTLTYVHIERFVIGGAMPVEQAVKLPAQPTGGAFLERRELGIVNVGGAARVVVDGTEFALGQRDALYVPMGTADVTFASASAEQPAKLYLVSTPAHARFETKKLSIDAAVPLQRGSLETSNERTIYQLIIPGVCRSAQLLLGMTLLKRAPLGGLLLLRPGTGRSRVPFHGRARRGPAAAARQRAGDRLAAVVDPHGRGHQELRLRLGDGRREPGLHRHERAGALPAEVALRPPQRA
jgi:4-deoxy-L-threo-5-hexosulose-uronate ketol-isomerase